MKEEKRCIFWKDGKCNSDYAKVNNTSIKCDGVNEPENCPYSVVLVK